MATSRVPFVAVLLFAFGVCGCSGSPLSNASYLDYYSALTAAERINVVVEIPAGTNAKWEVEKTTGSLHWEQEDGMPRVIQYLAYPANYGMVPRTSLPRELGGDGDPLDVLLLGPAVERGAIVPARAIGVLRLLDDDERDDKIVAVQTSGPLSDVTDLADLESEYPGARRIIEIWFTNYKGPDRIQSNGFADAAAAMAVVREASRNYEERAQPAE